MRRSGSSQSGALLLSLTALVVSASITYYIADSAVDLIFFGVALYSLLSGLILITLRQRIFSHMVGFLVIENGVFLFSTAIGVEMPLVINFAIPCSTTSSRCSCWASSSRRSTASCTPTTPTRSPT